jgi:hypothetical protein
MDGPMITPGPKGSQGTLPDDTEVTVTGMEGSDEPVMTLRGAGVGVNVPRIGRVVICVCLAALAALTVVLFVAGAEKNSQITRLRQHGVAVEVTMTGCLGMMGGSGSNLAGYACRGTFTVNGHRYNESIPGNTLHLPGATVRAVTVPGDPALVSPVGAVATEHPSGRVFILPIILLVVLVLVVAALFLRRRHVDRASPQDSSAAP